jgi:hypothetical protein
MKTRRPNAIAGKLASLALASALLQAGPARAAESVIVGVNPASANLPGSTSSFPNALTSLGLSVELDHYFPEFSGGIAASFLFKSESSLLGISYKQYFLGRHQEGSPETDPAKVDREAVPLIGEYRHIGAYVEVGPALYQVSNSTVATTGYGLQVSAAVEYPLFSFLFAAAKATLFTSTGGPSSAVLGSVQLGIPFAF